MREHSEGNVNGKYSTSSDSGSPNGLKLDTLNSRNKVSSFAEERAFFPIAPRMYRMALRAASTVVNKEGFSLTTFLAKVKDGVFGKRTIKSSVSFILQGFFCELLKLQLTY